MIDALSAAAGSCARHPRAMAGREYRLVVEGELGDRVAAAFEGMTVTCEEGKTALVGTVRDQAELHGLLQRISDLGLELLGATVVEDETREERAITPS